ncbi:MAG: ATP-binding cassette domain-containing protein [Bifidobacteriaceae bacterium]|jgi:energy-coupling factor transport system ATP-binding protein|nr:ATP-binding cassette domain-containing protein [Bifidobacteriaceae bacterium]
MIEFDNVSFAYTPASSPVLSGLSCLIAEGQLALLAGVTGAGKSTMLRMVNGLVPHFSGGQMSGQVLVNQVSTRQRPPRYWANLVGYVPQEPAASFVTEHVESELAYGMTQLGVASNIMRARVEETLDLLGIAELRDRPLVDLSGGQAQRVAIGAALAAGPTILVLDEPTSALDPTAAEEVLAIIARLVHDLGMTVLLAEHRLERAIQFADQLLYLDSNGFVSQGEPAEVAQQLPIAPPIVELGRLAGWQPLPTSVRQARRQAESLRKRLPTAALPAGQPAVSANAAASPPHIADTTSPQPPVVEVRNLSVCYGPIVAVDNVSFQLPAGRVTAIMGRNGSGKSSLLWAIRGVGPRSSGQVLINGQDPAQVHPHQARQLAALVPAEPGDLLYLDSVAAELGHGQAAVVLARIAPQIDLAAHPRDLSEGERLCLALALQLVANPAVVLLDEPTRGLDYQAKTALTGVLRGLAGEGCAVVLVTHDVEFAAGVADHVLTMAEGQIVTDGAARQALTASPALAPQVARILGLEWQCLTVDDVRQALGMDTPTQPTAVLPTAG